MESISLGPVTPDATGDDALAQNWTSHSATGVDKLHAQGILGEGVVVGVVDTGVYYPHPAVRILMALSLLTDKLLVGRGTRS